MNTRRGPPHPPPPMMMRPRHHMHPPIGEPDDDEQKEMTGHLSDEAKARRAELEKAPMQAELKYLEKRYTKKGRLYVTEPKEDEDLPDQSINWHEKFVLCVTRLYDPQNRYVTQTSLQVNSPALRNLLRDVVGYYPGQSFHTSAITIDFPAHCLYFCRNKLRAVLDEQEPGSDLAAHLPILLEFINEQHKDAIKEGDNFRAEGLMSYEHLWTIFEPESLVYATRIGQPRIYKLNSFQYVDNQCAALELNVDYVDYDGTNFGKRSETLRIPKFKGTAPIAGLPVMPLSFHPDPERVSRRVIARGRRWEKLSGQTFCEYKGVAREYVGTHENGDRQENKFNIEGRVMVDTHTYHRIEADQAFFVERPFPAVGEDATPERPNSRKRRRSVDSEYESDSDSDSEAEDWNLVPEEDVPKRVLAPLTDDQCLLATSAVRGFSFTEKKFLEFSVDQLRDVEWNSESFEQLVLPNQQKELVQALVAEHTQRTTTTNAGKGLEDIVKGKGLGLVLVLHGPPGVGKTLTAECVAEFSKRPLYTVSSGDLGMTAHTLDEKLTRTLDLASTWNAVLLIDEADVFLERRSLHDMDRNALVSIFLRTLEYYSGILFMTTNRVRTFDDAFKSRIHVPLKYEDLPTESRLKVWKNFLGKLEGEDGGVDIDEAGYRSLAEGRLNGRQIKNIVRTAKSLANYKRRRLDHDQLKQVMDIQMTFEAEMNGDDDVDVVEH
ncbi:AAA family ATPase [Podospora didyma]|uniref:AAA family ATPase n=1 Tax=Podospora didyma TaxID=330526 RepID=A0AAE0K786_9PEZI|nr:AAA family ATPase [Podospora didyma]